MTADARANVRCPGCGSDQTMTVTMTVAGSPTRFTMCTACEWKGWLRDGRALSLDSILSMVSGG